jgi:hypothetical protein
MGALDVDIDARNCDWPRASIWDIPIDVDQCLASVAARSGDDGRYREAVARFLTLPAARAMLPAMRVEFVGRELYEGRV